MSTLLIYKFFTALLLAVLATLCLGSLYRSEGDVGGGDSSLEPQSRPFQALNLTLRAALAAAVENNPDVLLYKERIEAARGQVQTQLGALLPNFSSTVRQTRQTQFRGVFGLAPIRSDPFSIFDVRVSASQNLLSVSLIQRWRASREMLHVSESESESRKFDTMASVALTYMEGLKAMGMVKMHEANQQVMNDLLGLIKQRQRVGVATFFQNGDITAMVAVVRSDERDGGVQVLVIVPIDEASDPRSRLVDGCKAVPWIGGRILQMTEERLGKGVVVAHTGTTKRGRNAE